MSTLDNRSLIKQLDQNNYLSHILDIPEQIVSGYALGVEFTLPALYAQAKQVVLLASGESLPVALALESLALAHARVPVVVTDDYTLPRWVTNDTLVIALDYSGNSDQVLTTFQEAANRRARLLAVSVGGDVARIASRYRAPHVPLTYGAPTRIAFYHAFACLAALFHKLDLAEVRESTATEAAVLCRSLIMNINPEVAQYQNNAKQLAEKIYVNQAIVIGSGPLYAIAKKWQISLAMTGKGFIFAGSLSAFNDTMVTATHGPVKGQPQQLLVILQSKYDQPRNKLQQTLTYQIMQAQKTLFEQIFMHPSGSLFGELVLASALGDMVAYYHALLTGAEPSLAEAPQFIREQLAKERNTSESR